MFNARARRGRIWLLAGSGALALLLAGCAGTTPQASDDAASSEPAVLTIAQGADILSLDPADHGNNSTESTLVNIYDYLVNKDFSSGQLEFVPGLAETWEQTSPTSWVFHLTEGVTWHNGDPFTAEDVKFTVERTQGDATLSSSSKFRTVASVEVIDDYTVQVNTDGVDSLLLHRFVGNGAGIIPKAAFEAAGSAEAFFADPIGTGPYEFEEWVKGDRVVLTKNEDWWGGDPKWDEVVIRAIPETATRVSELLTGGVDIAVNIPPEDDERVNSSGVAHTTAFDIARNLALHVRTGEGWVTSDPLVREAIDIAIDRETIAEKIVSGYATPTRGLFPAEIPGHNPDLDENLVYDPERAKELLAEAGYADGISLKLSTPSGRYLKDREIVEAVAGYLEAVGITVDVEVLDWTVYNTTLENDGFGELYLWGMGSYTDGSSLFDGDFEKHYEWSDPEFTQLKADVATAETDEERIEISQRGQEIVTDQRVRIGLVYPQSNIGVNDRIEFAGRFDEMIPAEEVVLQ